MSLDQLIELLHHRSGLTAFLGAFLWGNSVTLLLATLAGQLELSVWPVLIFACAGNFLRDLLLFALGRSHLVERLVSHERVVRAYKKLAALRARYQDRDWLFFVVLKFIYGLRFAALFYFGSVKYSWGRFLLYNGYGVIAVNLTIAISGWLVGQGVGLFTDALKNLKVIGTVLIVVLAIYLVARKLAQTLINLNATKNRESRE